MNVDMPDELHGIGTSMGSEYVELVESKENLINVSLMKMVIKTSPDVRYVKNDAGNVFVEKLILKDGRKLYYILHSKEIMESNIAMNNENCDHAIYSVA